MPNKDKKCFNSIRHSVKTLQTLDGDQLAFVTSNAPVKERIRLHLVGRNSGKALHLKVESDRNLTAPTCAGSLPEG